MNDAPEQGRAAEIEPFWLDYQRARAVKVEGFSASPLGHTRHLADTLAELVAAGVKRAHATLLRDFEKDLEPLPQPGDHLVVLDGTGTPRAIVRTTHVEKRRFNEILDGFVEGSGAAHDAFGDGIGHDGVQAVRAQHPALPGLDRVLADIEFRTGI